LFGHLALLERRIQRAVQTHPDAPENLPIAMLEKLYVSQNEIHRLLGEPTTPPISPDTDEQDLLNDLELAADEAHAAGYRLPLRELAEAFKLTPHDLEMLLVALAPHIDSRFGRFYSYLNQDTGSRQPTIGTVLYLTGRPATDGRTRSRIITGPITQYRLWEISHNEEEPLLNRPLQVADRIVSFTLDQNDLDTSIAHLVTRPTPQPIMTTAMRQYIMHICNALAHQNVVYIQEPKANTVATHTADAALQTLLRQTPLGIDLHLLSDAPDATTLLTLIVREARLRGCGLRAGPVEALSAPQELAHLMALCMPGTPLVLTGAVAWHPQWGIETVYQPDPPSWTAQERAEAWRMHLTDPALVEDRDTVVQMMAPYALGPDEIARAAESARIHAALAEVPVTAPLLRAAARQQHGGGGLERLARHITPAMTWDALVVPTSVQTQLQELTRRAHYREQVLQSWQMRPGGGRGHGVCALFTGEPGTGKTLAAEVIAAEVGLDLYVINLATVVDKYIGETEKNIERLFSEAHNANAILFFDEADAIFGKRSDVKDSNDRYANLETAYLLQQLERYSGIAILATNLFANIDRAFTRRLDMITHFPNPNEDLRRALWDICLNSHLPRSDDLDLDHVAQSFELNGGDIRCCAITAAYEAAASRQPITTHILLNAIRHEYTKLGRLVDIDKFKYPVEPEG
jgi:hypothetical protein